MALSVTGNGLIVGSSNLIEICQRPEGCNLTVTVLGSLSSLNQKRHSNSHTIDMVNKKASIETQVIQM